MQSTTAIADRDLTAIRARGCIGLAVEAVAGVTRRRHVHESGSLRVRFPGSPGGALEAVTVNTGGGMTGGDAFDIDVAVGANARLTVTSTAAEKIYRSLGPPVTMNVTINVAAGGALTWLPQETILFDKAVLHRRIEVDLAADAHLVLVEPLVFGRTGMGESVQSGELRDSWRVRQNGKLIYAEGTRLGSPVAQTLADTAVAKDGVAIATALIVPGDEAITDAIQAMSSDVHGEVGVSAWNGRAVLRFCARDGAALRHDIINALGALRATPLPRNWTN
ncbi:MAG: urease accessory protein UreD [Xanthobacteraceae bacterium]|nr:urease accessory protein UreD [Xanthobacteraceae bacterium]